MREPRWRRYLRFWRPNPSSDVDDELRFHFAQRVEEFEGCGATHEEALAAARSRFGDLATVRSELVSIDQRLVRRNNARIWGDNVLQDIRYAVRSLRRQPAFTLAIVVTLGLAVGANVTVFSLVDALFFRPPAGVVDPPSVRRIYAFHPNLEGIVSGKPVGDRFSYPDFRSMQEATRGFARVAIDLPNDSADIEFKQSTTIAGVSYATAELLPMLGVRMEWGRTFSEADDDVNSPAAVAVVSSSLARRMFADSTDPLSATIRVNGKPLRVIGVVAGPFSGLDVSATDVWIPFSNRAHIEPNDPVPWYARRDSYVQLIVRLLPGVDAGAFEARASTAYQRGHDVKARAYMNAHIIAGPLPEARGPGNLSREELIAPRIAGVAVLLFIIACANVANLLLARAWTRRREFAVRAALGISRARLGMLVFLEALVLAVSAGMFALVVGHWGGSLVRTQILPRVRWADAVLAPRIMVFAALVTFLSALLAGAAPALIVSANSADTLRSGTQHASGRRSRLRTTLIVVQTALAVVLVVGAFLFDESLRNVRRVDLGYDSNRLVVGSVYFPDRQRHVERGALLSELAHRIGAAKGVAGAVATYGGPLDSWTQISLYRADADSSQPITDAPNFVGVGPDYFTVTGTRILQGRPFQRSDRAGSEPVIIIGEGMAKQVWPNRPAIGQCLRPRAPSRPCYRVVGVAKDAHELRIINSQAETQYYFPLEQLPYAEIGPTTIIVRAGTASPDDIAENLRRMLRETFPTAEPRATSMTRSLEPQMRPWVLGARIFATLSGLALLVAMIGVYAMASFEARQRTREIGVRIALGAQSSNVISLLVRQETIVVCVGVICGALVALAAGRYVGSVLFGVAPSDPAALVGASAILLVSAAVASFIPSWRATQVDPVVVLRDE